MKLILIASLLLSPFLLGACATAPATETGKADIRDAASRTIANAQRNDPTITPFIRDAAGYAVFPTIGKGAVGVGGAYGKGVLFENGVSTGYCDVSQGTIGFQLGGQSYSEIISFQTAEAVNRFKTGNFAFDAQATAVALKSGAGTNAQYANGVAVFTMDEAGLMFEAAIGGQKFSYQPK